MATKRGQPESAAIAASPGIFSDFFASRSAVLLGAALIAGVTFLAYRPCLNGKFIWDDDWLISQNDLIRGEGGLARIWFSTDAVDYWPVTNSSFWVDWRLWQMNPLGYHLVNVALHLVSVFLLWAVLRALAIPGSFLAALLFAVHPLNVESVAWIVQRKNLLALVFYLLSILWYLKSVSSPSGTAKFGYIASIGAFLLAMLSKGSVAVLPVMLLLIAWWRGSVSRRDWVRIVPYAVIAVALTGVNVWFQSHGAHEPFRSVSPLDRVLGAGGVVWFYLLKSLLPFDLEFIYPQWEVDAANFLWWIPVLTALGVSFVFWRKRGDKIGRSLWFAWSTYCVALLPVMGFVDVGYMRYSLVADHYAHLALVSIVAAVAAGVYLAASRVSQAGRATIPLATAATIAGLFFATQRQAQLYESPLVLFQDTVAKNPDSGIAHNLYGRELHLAGDVHAVDEYRRAIELKLDTPEAFADLGAALLLLGDTEGAIKNHQAALDRAPGRPDLETHMAAALLTKGDRAGAKILYSKVVDQKPDYALAQAGLGNVALSENDLPEAIARLRRAVELKPDYTDAHFNLGIALQRSGDMTGAITQMEEVLRQQPDYAQAENVWGIALFQANQFSDAIEHLQRAVQLNPNDFAAYSNLATCYRKLGRIDLAIHTAQAALLQAQAVGDAKWAEQIRSWLEQQRNSTRDSSATPGDR